MFEMKKTLCRVILILGIFALAVLYVFYGKQDFNVVSCIDTLPALKTAYFTMGEETEDMTMHLVYQLARRNIVKVTAKSFAGSGIIWKIDNDIIIASNKHILMNDVKANITFCNGDIVLADVIGYSQQYDIGFVRVDDSFLTDKLLRYIYDVVPVIFPCETNEDRISFFNSYGGLEVMQVGINYDNGDIEYCMGTIKELEFQPLFNTNIIVSNAYAKAGMSGGGIYDDSGRLLGMISGGDVPPQSNKKESDTTYSLPARLIQEEYELIISERQED
jgi:S1-C subfamily serine protease